MTHQKLFNPFERPKLTYSGSGEDQAILNENTYYRRTQRKKDTSVAYAVAAIAILAFLALLSAISFHGFKAAVCTAAPIVLISLVVVWSSGNDQNQMLLVDRKNRIVGVWLYRPNRPDQLATISFNQIEKLRACHYYNDMWQSYKFFYRGEVKVDQKTCNAIASPGEWQLVGIVQMSDDDIAQWIGCPIEHEYS